MKKILDNTLAGSIFGVLLPAITFFLIYTIKFSKIEFAEFIDILFKESVFPHFVSLSGIPNLLLFYLYIRRNWIRGARGVVLSTFLLAGLIIYLKYG